MDDTAPDPVPAEIADAVADELTALGDLLAPPVSYGYDTEDTYRADTSPTTGPTQE
ncbi:hypothetical protein BDK92_7167 [Micromonospora pisi]|uniref:Uncharacterized protein n=1 Tax=Micromonospora pisi TaxID=589240 RepID=A0A495JWY8_9ACTN|nr:hypothetical protein [Micromonospora pisi]RKR92689.1 hypothetical protein BDK92_7167 [Micromonospora pisi]